ncbi:MAG TPA: L,D-transpeptidase family protein [Thermomicrobiaceae bacterium]|nr:L,D-transpeptidase family protein [Thermomicrobiaceae bacterium]
MRRSIAVAVVLLLIALLVSGCGGAAVDSTVEGPSATGGVRFASAGQGSGSNVGPSSSLGTPPATTGKTTLSSTFNVSPMKIVVPPHAAVARPSKSARPTGEGGGTEDPRWDLAIQTTDGGRVGIVVPQALNIRSAPHLDAPVVGQAYAKHPITVYGQVSGDSVNGDSSWFRVGSNQYVSASLVTPFVPAKPAVTHQGHWVDIDLSTFYAVAYDGAKPIYAAIIIAGEESTPTPLGTFAVMSRVRNETMDSATVGVPPGSPGYYYLPNVQFTQYFAPGGYALHENYWSQPWQYGTVGSHGCINLQLADAQWFWNFLSVGSVVIVHR